jgi:hypothetical protein
MRMMNDRIRNMFSWERNYGWLSFAAPPVKKVQERRRGRQKLCTQDIMSMKCGNIQKLLMRNLSEKLQLNTVLMRVQINVCI